MNPFQYVSAQTPDEAISYIGTNGRYLAGGIDLLGEMKDHIISPDILVNVKNLDTSGFPPQGMPTPPLKIQLTFSPNESGGFWLSSTVTMTELSLHADLKKALPGVVEAASEVGSPQIRDVATLGGNLLQHSRCWYYRQPDIVCLKRGGDECHSHEGENK